MTPNTTQHKKTHDTNLEAEEQSGILLDLLLTQQGEDLTNLLGSQTLFLGLQVALLCKGNTRKKGYMSVEQTGIGT